jgi:hypothetical protein
MEGEERGKNEEEGGGRKGGREGGRLTGSVIGSVMESICPCSFHSARSGMFGTCTLKVTGPCSGEERNSPSSDNVRQNPALQRPHKSKSNTHNFYIDLYKSLG